ncbi:MAG TPA: hypothetical protein VGQ83_14710 [Polyangia bacterium]|jgi:hypothetical protein
MIPRWRSWPCLALAALALAPGCDRGAPARGGETAPAVRPTAPKDYGKKACRLARACYQRHRTVGPVAGHVEVTADAAGHGLEVSYTGSAPTPVRECMAAEVRKLFLRGYAAGPGVFVCDYHGEILAGGVEKIDQQWSFRPAGPASAPATQEPR